MKTVYQESTWIELSQSRLAHNLRQIANHLNGLDKVCCVVKGDAYGHGLNRIVPLLQASGVSKYAVYHADEAIQVRRIIGKNGLVVLLGYAGIHEISSLATHDIECLLLNKDRLPEINSMIPPDHSLRIHLKIDTGMNRFGLKPEGIPAFLELLKTYPKIKLTGAASHFANAWNFQDTSYALGQQNTFEQALSLLGEINGQLKYRHISNTGAMLVHPDFQYSFVRSGVGIYGYYPNKSLRDKFDSTLQLKPILSFRSRLVSIKHLDIGEYVGYDITFQAERPTKLALAPVGYSDGFPFTHSATNAFALLRGQRVPLVGRVNMNAIFLDITDVEEAAIGDTLTLLGEDGGQEISVWDWIDWGTPHHYESLTKLRTNLPRYIVA